MENLRGKAIDTSNASSHRLEKGRFTLNRWYEKMGKDGDIVISSRIRLARNLRSYPFPIRMSAKQCREVEESVKEAFFGANEKIGADYISYDLERLPATEAYSLAEKHLISPEFAKIRTGKGLILKKDASVSIMINEEDHLRIQVIKEGLDLDATWEIANAIDTMLDEKLGFAFDANIGYLTQCPTNLGTGMRASVMQHLPALQNSGAIHTIAPNISKIGLTLRGIYGEGSEPKGAIYQLSNQVTLGISEKDAIDNLKNIVQKLIVQERNARRGILENDSSIDKIWRSLGLLKSARTLPTEEFMQLISNIRIGVSLGVIEGIGLAELNKLMVSAQPNTLQQENNSSLAPEQRDMIRASVVRDALKSCIL